MVRAAERHRDQAGGRRQLNDVPRPLLAQVGQRGLNDPHRTEQVGLQLVAQLPLGQLLAVLGRILLAGAGGWFWPTVLLYGLLGAAIELVSAALGSVAYRRVARS